MTQSNSPKLTVVIRTKVVYYLENGGTETESLGLTIFESIYGDNKAMSSSLEKHIQLIGKKEDKSGTKADTRKTVNPTKMTTQENRDRAIFGDDRQKAYEEFLVVKEELTGIGVKFGELLTNRSTMKCWSITWDQDEAGLYWTPNEWTVEPLKYEQKLKGNWEGFDLEAQLECNDISFTEYEE